MEQRLPPYSLEAEQAVLGGLMLQDDAWDRVAGRVMEADFYRKDHRLIYQAIGDLANSDRPRDVVTVSEWLQGRGQLEDAGGLAYLGTLANDVGSAANIGAYADIVRERSVYRKLIKVGTDITDMGFTPEGRPATELLDEAERKVLDIAESSRRTTSGPRAGAEFLGDVVERIEKLVGGQLAGTSTGLVDLDKKTTGLHPGDLVIVAGRPSMGKTSFSMNIAEAIATDPQTPKAVLVFSLEMPGDQLMMRMISSFGRVNQERLRSGNLTDEDWDKIHSAMTLLERAPIYIDDDGQLSPTELRSRARRLKREVNNIRSEQFPEGLELGLILVDYLQLMQVPGFKENRTNEIAMISRGMKSLAKELEVPVIALSQLNRSVENRDDKRPRMADLRESGGIEQDADVIMFIYRDEVYNPETDRRGIAEIIIAKQRNGPIGKVDATFTGQYTRFDNVAHYQDDEF
ncbi:replicative DNA helicase [Abyssibacter profundi]|uniref:Replicative DNA helicase n=1 Tax=Abyssibacter profundi TaxID=2182787 RepID=A0A363UP03_9GAMM|nr:replicative DNA helicase [Abyssibacter profundi]MBV60251.1 replicative DNA helicase [Nevskiales bacterium]PWN57164.1 replicative DNA helicase [Abyssibacter profundi]